MKRALVSACFLVILFPLMALAALPLDEPAVGLQCGYENKLFTMDASGRVKTIVAPEYCGWNFAVSLEGHPLTATNRGPAYSQHPTLWRIDPGTGKLIQLVSGLPMNIQCIAVNPVPVPAPGGDLYPADSVFIVVQPQFNPQLLVVRPGERSYEVAGRIGNPYNWWHDSECAFRQDGKFFVVTEILSHRGLHEVDTATGELLSNVLLRTDKVDFLESIAFTPNGDLLATGNTDGRTWSFVVDPETGKVGQKHKLKAMEDSQPLRRSTIAVRSIPQQEK